MHGSHSSGDIVAVDFQWTGEGTDAPVVEMPLGMAVRVRDGRLTLVVGGRRGADARDRLLGIAPDESAPRAQLGRDTDRTASEDNIATIRAIQDAMDRGDVDGALEHVAPDIELDGTSTQAWQRVYRGRDEVMRFWRAFTEPWESVRGEIEEFIPAPGDAVVTRATAYFVGRDGIEVTNQTTGSTSSETAYWSGCSSSTISTTPSPPPACPLPLSPDEKTGQVAWPRVHVGRRG